MGMPTELDGGKVIHIRGYLHYNNGERLKSN